MESCHHGELFPTRIGIRSVLKLQMHVRAVVGLAPMPPDRAGHMDCLASKRLCKSCAHYTVVSLVCSGTMSKKPYMPYLKKSFSYGV